MTLRGMAVEKRKKKAISKIYNIVSKSVILWSDNKIATRVLFGQKCNRNNELAVLTGWS